MKRKKPVARKAPAKKVSAIPGGTYYFLMYKAQTPFRTEPSFAKKTLKEIEDFLMNGYIDSDNYDVYEVEVVNVRKLEKKVCWAGEEEDCG